MEWKNSGGWSIRREEGWKREREDRMLTCMRGFTVGTGLLQIRGIRLTEKKKKTKTQQGHEGWACCFIHRHEGEEEENVHVTLDEVWEPEENWRYWKDWKLSYFRLFSLLKCLMCLWFIAGDLVALQRELKPRHTRRPTGPVDLQIWLWCVQWWWWSTKGAKEGGSHWCPGRGFLFRSLDPQMMWGKKWKPSCTFFSFEDYSWPLSDRWRKAQMQC